MLFWIGPACAPPPVTQWARHNSCQNVLWGALETEVYSYITGTIMHASQHDRGHCLSMPTKLAGVVPRNKVRKWACLECRSASIQHSNTHKCPIDKVYSWPVHPPTNCAHSADHKTSTAHNAALPIMVNPTTLCKYQVARFLVRCCTLNSLGHRVHPCILTALSQVIPVQQCSAPLRTIQVHALPEAATSRKHETN